MILIVTTNNDQITAKICLWLLNFNKKYQLISDSDEIYIEMITSYEVIINNRTRNYCLTLNSIKSVLYRQGDIRMFLEDTLKVNKFLSDYLNKERKVIQEFIYYKITKVFNLGHPLLANLNKLIILDMAKSHSLKVPEYIYTYSKKKVIEFLDKENDIITKIILPSFNYIHKNKIYASYTTLLDDEKIKALPDKFCNSFFQKNIKKKFEIRVFYLQKKYFSVAIFSQNDVRTSVDYREFQDNVKQKMIRFNLPLEIEKQLNFLISELKLNYCSVDLLYGIDKQIYFLEINPIGQFGAVSYAGNYYLEKEMAKLL